MTEDLFKQGVVLFNSGDKEKARNVLMKVVNQEPEDADAWYGLALCESNKEMRIFCLKRAIKAK